MTRKQTILVIVYAFVIISTLLYFALLRGFFYNFFGSADADLVYLEQALRFNGGRPQTYFDHTGYLYSVLLSLVYKIGTLLGFVSHSTIQSILSSDQVVFDIAQLIFLGRFFSIILSISFVGVFTYIIFKLYRSIELALIAGILLTVSSGTISHSLILRPELLSALCAMCGCLFIVKSCYSTDWKMNTLYGGFFIYASLMVKIQAVVSIVFYPLIIIALTKNRITQITFGPIPIFEDIFGKLNFSKVIAVPSIFLIGMFNLIPISYDFIFRSDATTFSFLYFLVFIHLFKYQLDELFKIKTIIIFVTTLFLINAMFRHHFNSNFDIIKLIYIYLTICIFTFVIINKIDFRYALIWCFIFFIGCSFAFLLNYYHPNVRNTNYLLDFANYSAKFVQGREHSILRIFDDLVDTIIDRFSLRTPYQYYSNPLVYFTSFVSVLFLLSKKWIKSLQLSVLILVPIFIETFTRSRYIAVFYHVYFDWVIILGFIHSISLLFSTLKQNKRIVLTASLVLVSIVICQSVYNNYISIKNNSYSALNLKMGTSGACFVIQIYSPSLFKHFGDRENCSNIFTKENIKINQYYAQ